MTQRRITGREPTTRDLTDRRVTEKDLAPPTGEYSGVPLDASSTTDVSRIPDGEQKRHMRVAFIAGWQSHQLLAHAGTVRLDEAFERFWKSL